MPRVRCDVVDVIPIPLKKESILYNESKTMYKT